MVYSVLRAAEDQYMRISRKYLVPYLWDSCTKLNDGEKLYWLLAVSLCGICFVSSLIIWKSFWTSVIIFFWLLAMFRFPLFTNGKYPMSQRKVYKPKQR